MDNPWLLLPAAQPFVVQADAAVVAAFNRKYAGTPYALHTELPPEPFSGRLDAPVVLLDFHPGYSGNDAAIMPGNEEFSLRECPAYTLLYQFSPKDTGQSKVK